MIGTFREIPVEPTPPPMGEVTITMTAREAVILLKLTKRISGAPREEGRGTTDALGRAIQFALTTDEYGYVEESKYLGHGHGLYIDGGVSYRGGEPLTYSREA